MTGTLSCALFAGCGVAQTRTSVPSASSATPAVLTGAMAPPNFEVSSANALTTALASQAGTLLPELEAVYKDLHQRPELSMHEVRTAKIAADWIQRYGYEVSRGVGKTGVVGVLRNGAGPTVMLRADMDGLPMTEATGLSYASTVKAQDDDGATVGVFHGCGHDMHVTWLMGAARVLSEHRGLWHGTALVVFQPGEELGRGAQSMMDDKMAERFPKPVELDFRVCEGASVGARCDEQGSRRAGTPQCLSAFNAAVEVDVFAAGGRLKLADGIEVQIDCSPIGSRI
ncbi:MAG TPA: M20/M25/M40 family metallo-hydrolase [Polyangiaceae bacterium]|nr:M20/M25/M40 family metallo-hydrolase [Polyangiaceae bacterium]